MTREEAAAKALRGYTGDCTCHEAYTKRNLRDPDCSYHQVPPWEAAPAALAAADAYDAANGVHRVTLDQPTVEKAARELLWRVPELGRNPAVAMDAVRAIIRAAAVKEGQ
jgi:hypothetical protein